MTRVIDRIRTEERGAFLLLFSILLVVLFIILATVIDLGALRADAREDQSVADMAATAGAAELDPLFGGSPKKACRTAWGYFLANTPDAPQNAADPCAPFGSMPVCTVSGIPATKRVTGTAGAYTVSITYPVRDGAAEMQGRVVREIDGDECSRFAVEVDRSRNYHFGAIMGARSGTTTMTAVARTGSTGDTGQTVSLIILDPTGCNALLAKGQTTIKVLANGGLPGIIAVDSNAKEMNPPTGQSERSCANGGAYAIDATGTQNASIFAGDGVDENGNPVPGRIFSYALQPGQNNAQSYENADVATGRLAPRPIGNERITRQPVDHRFNCKAANQCPAASVIPAHIDALRAQVGVNGRPPGFQEFPAAIPGARCNMTPSMPPLLLVGDWWINCSNFSVSTPTTITGNVVSQGTITVGSSGSLIVNPAATSDKWIYFRNGDFAKDAQASIRLERTFVYLNNGRITFGAGSGITRWIAPTAGNFEDLALWSESSLQHELGGQASLELEGTYFTPNALPFRYSGQGGQAQVGAQFITYRLESTGQGQLIMKVDPERSVKVKLLGIKLIR